MRVSAVGPVFDLLMSLQMEMEGADAKSAFGGSNKRARTAAPGSEWAHSRVFSDEEAEGDARTGMGAANAPSLATRKNKTAGALAAGAAAAAAAGETVLVTSTWLPCRCDTIGIHSSHLQGNPHRRRYYYPANSSSGRLCD